MTYTRSFDPSHEREHRRLATVAAIGWDDLRIDVTAGTRGVTNPPGFEAFRTNVYANAFDKGTLEAVYFDVQLPHSAVSGTDLRPHIHWSPGVSTDTGAVVWGLDYTWANPVNPPDNTFPAVTSLSVTDTASGTAYEHRIAPWDAIDGSGMRASAVLMCRLYRDAANVADTFDADAWALSVDFHYQSQGFGSTDEYPTS